jgi:hypothetical protein
MPLQFDYADNSRGLGILDMARHLEEGTPFRTSSDLLYHALEVMCAFVTSGDEGGFINIETKPAKPQLRLTRA